MSVLKTALTLVFTGLSVIAGALWGMYLGRDAPGPGVHHRTTWGEVMSPEEAARRGYTVCVHVRPSLGPDGNLAGTYGTWTCTLPPVGPRIRGEAGLFYVEEPDPCAFNIGGKCP